MCHRRVMATSESLSSAIFMLPRLWLCLFLQRWVKYELIPLQIFLKENVLFDCCRWKKKKALGNTMFHVKRVLMSAIIHFWHFYPKHYPRGLVSINPSSSSPPPPSILSLPLPCHVKFFFCTSSRHSLLCNLGDCVVPWCERWWVQQDERDNLPHWITV